MLWQSRNERLHRKADQHEPAEENNRRYYCKERQVLMFVKNPDDASRIPFGSFISAALILGVLPWQLGTARLQPGFIS